MSVFFYDEGEHGTGFIGFRVARTIGCNKDYRQKYYSLKEMDYDTAKERAYELDEEWRKEAELVKRANRIAKPKKLNSNVVASGLRAEIAIERRKVKSGSVLYFYPCFLVKQPGRNQSCTMFRTSHYGYKVAYSKAVDLYCELHELNKTQHKDLLTRMPEPNVFTSFLLDRVKGREIDICRNELLDKLRVAN